MAYERNAMEYTRLPYCQSAIIKKSAVACSDPQASKITGGGGLFATEWNAM